MKLCPPAQWDSLARADESATFFQTPAWHALAQDFEGTQTTPLLCELGDGAVAVLPLQARKRWWGKLLSTPFGTYSALLRAPGSPKLEVHQTTALAAQLLRLNLNLPGSPFAPLPSGTVASMASLKRAATFPQAHTHVLRLKGLNPTDWVPKWSRNHRRLLKTAQETGYTVRLATGSADLAAYCALYKEQAQRWGTQARRLYPDELFQEAVRRFSADGSLKLWVAEGPEGIVAGRLCLYHGTHAVEWHAAAQTAAMHKGVNHLVVHEIVSQARAAGYGIYDFNPNPGLDAVDHFKRGFATEALPFEGLQNRTGFAGLLTQARRLLKTS